MSTARTGAIYPQPISRETLVSRHVRILPSVFVAARGQVEKPLSHSSHSGLPKDSIRSVRMAIGLANLGKVRYVSSWMKSCVSMVNSRKRRISDG